MINPLLLPELREMLASGDADGLHEFCTAMHPANTADFLAGLSPAETWQAMQHVDAATRNELFHYFDRAKQVEMVEQLDRQQIAGLISGLAADERVDILKQARPDVLAELLPLLSIDDRRDILRLIAFPEGTAGAAMTTDFARIGERQSVRQALDEIARQAAQLETIYYVYVVDEENHLRGVVSGRQLIAAMVRPETPVGELMERSVEAVLVDEDQEEVARKVAKYDLLAIPVVDRQRHLIGIITHDDVLDILVEETTEDAYRMAGVGALDRAYFDTPFTTIWRKRAMWLSCLFVAELFTFTALASYEQQMETVFALTLFVPLCISTGGNSGSQAATLITRALALGEITPREWFRVLRHELLMGLALGVTLGAMGYARAIFTPQDVLGNAERWQLALVISNSVMAICLWGTLIGSLLPLIMRAVRVDPAYASSPFVATFVDVTGIMIYVNIAKAYLPQI